jgi:type I restriction enzyme R subunit
MLLDAGVGTAEDIERAKENSKSLGLFIRTLVGLDREAAKDALGEFFTRTNATANQIEFLNLIVDHLTEHGVVSPALLYESPFTYVSPRGPEGLFSEPDVEQLVAILNSIQDAATAA